MAFPTTHQRNTALFRNLFFRTSDNAPISSLYVLNTNSQGETFWTKSLTPQTLSSLSTFVNSTILSYETYTLTSQTDYILFSTTTFPNRISTYQGQFNSTYSSQENNILSIPQNFVGLTNQQEILSNSLQGSLVIQTNQVYISSISIAQSTLDSYTNPSTYMRELSSLYSTFSQSLSTLSSYLYITNPQIYSTVSSFFQNEFNNTLSTANGYTDNSLSTLSSILITRNVFNTYSTQYGLFQTQTLNDLSSSFNSQYNITSTYISSLTSSYTNTFNANILTVGNFQTNLNSIYQFSTNISSIISTQVSSIITGVFFIQDEKLSNYYSTLNNELNSVSSLSVLNLSIVSTISSFTFTSINSINNTNSTILASVSSLSEAFSTISISTILGSVYTIFNLFEIFCNDLVISTTSNINLFQSSLFYSTFLQNTSTTNNYFSTLFQIPFYTSTINNVSSLANNQLSSYIASTIIPGNRNITSSIQSTIIAKTNEYNQTIPIIFNQQYSTFTNLFQSSVQHNLSTPVGTLLSTVSTLGQISLSTFQNLGNSSIQGQVNEFSTQLNNHVFLQNTMFSAQVSTNSSFQSSFLLYSTIYNQLFRIMQTSSIAQNSIITSQYQSSLTSFTSQFNTMIVSTPANLITFETTNATNSLTILQTSTLQIYSNTVNSLTATISTLALSSLFTEQKITLSGSTFQANLDFNRFANFFINIYEPLINGSSSYRVTYDFYSISSIEYKSGIITLDISTPTSLYSNNGSYLYFDLCDEGLPNSIWTELYPSISSGNYLAMYEYTIQNNIVYTNLLNIYPRVMNGSLTIQDTPNTGISNSFWRGSEITVALSNYSYFPIGAIGTPAYRADVQIDAIISNQVVSQYGPFNANVSTAKIRLPYIVSALQNPVPLTLRSYVVGNPTINRQINMNMVMPNINYITVTGVPNKFLSFGEITANTNSGSNALLSNSRVFSYDGSGTSNAAYEIQAITFAGTSNSFMSILNVEPLRVRTNDFTVEWYQNLPDIINYPSTMTVFSMGTQPAINFGFAFERFTVSGNTSLNPVIFLNGLRYIFSGSSLSLEALGFVWNHFAVTRQENFLRIWFNGSLFTIIPIPALNITDSINAFTIGKETNGTSLTAFKGHITNFRFTNGTALYTMDPYAIPPIPIPSITNTVLLLNAFSESSLAVDSGPFNYPVTVSSISYTRFGKENAVDGNPSTIFIGASTISNPSAYSQFRVEPQLNNTFTSVSSLIVRNVPMASFEFGNVVSYTINHNIFAGDEVLSHWDLEGAIMEIGVPVGTTTYISTITLRSTQTQVFVF